MINQLLHILNLPKEEYSCIQGITKITTNKTGDSLLLEVKGENLFSYLLYKKLLNALKSYFNVPVQLNLLISNDINRIDILRPYIAHVCDEESLLRPLQSHFPILENNALIYFDKNIQPQVLMTLQSKLNEIGIHVTVTVRETEEDETLYELDESMFVKPTEVKQQYRHDYVDYDIQDIYEACQKVRIKGQVFKVESRTFPSGKSLFIFSLKDKTDAIIVKVFENKKNTKEILDDIKEGMHLIVEGDIENDQYLRTLVFVGKNIKKYQPHERMDHAIKKRVELHIHTKMSEMDGVSEYDEYIFTAAKWGHRAIAITDHHVVQSFPKAQMAAKKVSTNENPFKLIYGVELSMIEPQLPIVVNPDSRELKALNYCVLDFETTGLSTYYDEIIEFGGQHLDGLTMKKSTQFFVKTNKTIGDHISQLTNISNDLLNKKGIAIEEALDRIVAFIGDRVIVAHNAEFDVSFLNDTLIKYNRQPLNNPVIDTLNLARSLHLDRKSYKLGNIARHYGIIYDEEGAHRADYDTEVLAQVFIKMIDELENITTLEQLQSFQPKKAVLKQFDTHVNVLVKNQAGLKSLFEIITLSHTEYLSTNATVPSPRIPRDILHNKRENLLIGSACSNNEIFEYALNRSDEKLKNAMAFYDYIEIQPRNCYRHLLRRNIVKSEEHLIEVIQRIINVAKSLDKIIVATSDAHYVDESQKNVRDIYISAQGIGGVRHPLFIYNKDERLTHQTYSQHLLTTDEMLAEFNYLDDALAYEIVVENSNKIADEIEYVYPVKKDLYPPVIENCDQKLKEIAYDNAHKKYGNPLPKIVADRLEKELNAIIGSGYHVVYYISHLLVKKSLDDGYLVGSRGSVGSSLVATMTNITEVNPLVAHYYCPNCCYSEFFEDGSLGSGYDLPDKPCPKCQHNLKGEGQDIPFETFLGFKGDKVPDIDLNFSGVYQPIAHQYTKEVFGESNVFRAGTIATVAKKTAYGYIKGYQEEMDIQIIKPAQIERLSDESEGVKRTTGQHPGGIIVIPNYMDVHDFTPVQYPANDANSEWKTTHFEFHDIHDNVLKLDILGHVDPTAMRFLQNISGIDPLSIPLNDEKVLKIFSSIETLAVDTTKYKEKTGAAGIPEFGTAFVRKMLETTKPTSFSELVQISGLSHGTDVWLNNAKDLIDNKVCTLKEVIGCRDDIMVYLIQKGLKDIDAFSIMESVRKGKGLKPEWIDIMKSHAVPDWYIDSCLKIKYMFPKAHAAAYVLMAVRIAWFKIYYPLYYYCMFFSIRCDSYDIHTMIKGENAILHKLQTINELRERKEDSVKDNAVYACLELAYEMVMRGYQFSNIDINLSHATDFMPHPTQENTIIPPFVSLDGLGDSVAISIVKAREEKPFISKEDLKKRTGLSTTLINKLDEMNVLNNLIEKNQMSLF